MKIDWITYQQAARLSGLSENLLRLRASRKTPPRNRLPVHRFGHRTVLLKRAEFEKWVNQQ